MQFQILDLLVPYVSCRGPVLRYHHLPHYVSNPSTIVIVSPGPGSYRLPSEFGYYGSKFAQTLDERQWKTAGGAEKPRTVSKPVNINQKSGTADPSVKATI